MFGGIFDRLRKSKRRIRSFAAAAATRFVTDWLVSYKSIDADLKGDIAKIRNRSRDLEKNSELAARYFNILETNVVGTKGFLLQMKVRKGDLFDDDVNREIERHWKRWSTSASADGRLSFREICKAAARGIPRDGEAFIRIVKDTGINDYGLSLQVIDPALIDDQYNDVLKNGNIIRLGVELNEYRKPVAYYISEKNPKGEMLGMGIERTKRIRIPAEEVIHIYKLQRPDQTRGWSWLAPVMLAMRILNGYIEGALVNARAGAAKMGFYETEDPGVLGLDDADDARVESAKTEPGMIEVLPPGVKFVGYDPKYPDNQFAPFVKRIMMLIASGLNVSYVSLSQDLEAVNYSSIRYGSLEERETFKDLQEMIVEKLVTRVFEEWLRMALTVGKLGYGLRNFDRLNEPSWVGPRWNWVDPLKEINANINAVKSGIKSRSEVIAENGRDFFEVMDEIAKENAYMLEMGINVDGTGQYSEVTDEKA